MPMVYEIRQTVAFDMWFRKLKDKTAKRKFLARFARIENGNFGDCKTLTQNLFEMRFSFGPGYRIYYTIQDNVIVLLLVGGDKSSQKKDIQKATEMVDNYENNII